MRSALGENGRAYILHSHERKAVLGRFLALLDQTPDGPREAGQDGHLLIFEPDARGHAAEWVRHLLAHLRRQAVASRLTLAVPQALVGELGNHLPPSVGLWPIEEQDLTRCLGRSPVVSAFARWRLMRRALRATGATHGLFLGIDHASLPLALGLPLAGRTVSGILFRPTPHYGRAGWGKATLRERVRDRCKDLLYDLMTRRRDVTRVYSLDPYFPDYAAKRYRGGHKVVPLGDPVFPIEEVTAADRKTADDLPPGRTTFLLFGEITERKGIFPLIDALLLLPREVTKRITVVIAGRIDPAIRRRVTASVEAVEMAHPDLQIVVIDRRLRFGEIAALVNRCHVVMAPYQRFVGSSGVLLWSAQMNRPVVGQAYGLVGELVHRFGLGLTVNAAEPQAIANAMVAAGTRGAGLAFDHRGAAAFLRTRQPQVFAATLLAAAAVPST